MVDRDVAGYRQTRPFSRHGPSRRPRRSTAGTGGSARRSRGPARKSRQRDRLGRRRNRSEPEARRDLAVVRNAATREKSVLRTQPHAVSERRRVLHRPQQHAGVRQRRLGLRERDASGLGQLAHLGELLTLEAHGQRAHRIHVRLIERAGAILEHLDQPRLVERRIGVRRASEARDAAGDRRLHLRLQRRLVLEAGLAQPRGKVDETRTDDQPLCVDDAVRAPAGRGVADRRDLAGRDKERRVAVDPVLRVDHAAVPDLDLHVSARPAVRRVLTAPPRGAANVVSVGVVSS